jgi:hypothetical protein
MDKWVSDLDLLARGISCSAQREARDTGRLPYITVGAGFSYATADIDAWLAGGGVGGRPAPATAPARQAAGGAAAGYGGSAKSQWESAVRQLTDNGTPPAIAIARVDETRPGLRLQMLAEVNAHRRDAPPALAHFKRLGAD